MTSDAAAVAAALIVGFIGGLVSSVVNQGFDWEERL